MAKKHLRIVFYAITLLLLSYILLQPKEIPTATRVNRDYPGIIASGVLRAVTEYNAISFHAQNDTIGGFHYELLNAFAKEKGIRLEITPEMSIEKRKKGIEDGLYDVLANDLLVIKDTANLLRYTRPFLLSKQVLIQRKPLNEDDSMHIDNPLELAHKTLYIVEDSPYKERIHHLSNEIGDTIYICEIKKYGPEQLLALVAAGDINYAICDQHIAEASEVQFPQLDFKTSISFTQFYSWAVHHNDSILCDSLNAWLDRYTHTQQYQELINKYY